MGRISDHKANTEWYQGGRVGIVLHEFPNVVMTCNRCILDCLSAFRRGIHRFPISFFHGPGRLVHESINLGLGIRCFANALSSCGSNPALNSLVSISSRSELLLT